MTDQHTVELPSPGSTIDAFLRPSDQPVADEPRHAATEQPDPETALTSTPLLEEPDLPTVAPYASGGFTPYVVGDPGHAAGNVMELPDRTFPDHHGIVLDGAAVRAGDDDPWTHLRAASVRGLSHRDGGKVRQDEYAFRQTDDDRFLVVAVADGVSEGEYSHEAAVVASRQGCALVAGWLRDRRQEDVPWTDVLAQLRTDIERRGRTLLRKHGVDGDALDTRELARRLSTTLVLGVVDLRLDDHDAHRVALLRVGDASAWRRDRRGRWINLHTVKNEGQVIASSATAALPHVSEIEQPVLTRVFPGDALALVTDGVGDPLGNGCNDFGDFLAEVWERPPPPLEFAAQVDFARKSFDDDRTAVVVWPG